MRCFCVCTRAVFMPAYPSSKLLLKRVQFLRQRYIQSFRNQCGPHLRRFLVFASLFVPCVFVHPHLQVCGRARAHARPPGSGIQNAQMTEMVEYFSDNGMSWFAAKEHFKLKFTIVTIQCHESPSPALHQIIRFILKQEVSTSASRVSPRL